MAIIKTTDEIEKIKIACDITDEIFKDVIFYIKKNKTCTENELQKYIVSLIRERKLRPSFPPIVTSGKRAGNDIHPKPTDNKLMGFVIIDLGVRYQGYCSDMTRTIYVGMPTEQEKEYYQTILNVQKKGIQLSVVGRSCSEIDAIIRKNLGPLTKYFIHTTGHGVGRKIHEAPIIYEKRIKPILKEGMVVTIEPGIYIKNKFGIRIEDTLLVTDAQPIVLTRTTKNLTCVSFRT